MPTGASCDLTVVRNTWDYPARLDEFLAWAGRAGRIVNAPDVLAWTTDKHYLVELQGAGLPVVATTVLRPGQPLEWDGAAVVVKPAVGVGSVDAGRHGDEGSAAAHVAQLHGDGRDALVQPFLPAIEERGETALIYLAGEFSHAIHKGPMLPASGIVRPYGLFQPENIAARDPSPAERETGDRVIAWLGERFGRLPYARIDVVPGPGGAPVVLECELAEPSLFLGTAPGAAERFAAAIAGQC